MSINELMTDDISKVDEFVAVCDDMINSRYILAEGKIAKILQTVAVSTVLQRKIAGALKGFDYGSVARDWSTGKIAPPFSEKDHVALVFCILADIDSRSIFLSDFLRKFFWNGDLHSAYYAFTSIMVEPFKNYVVGSLSNTNKNERPVDVSRVERKAMDLAELIQGCPSFTQNEREKLIFMCDGVATKARNDVFGARALAIGLKGELEGKPELESYVISLINELA